MNVEFFIAKRMLQNKKHSKSFSSAIVLISLIGIMLGVSVMILTVSVAVGFQTEIKNKLMSFGSHIQVESLYLNNNNETSPIITLQHNIDSISNENAIDGIYPYVLKSSIIQHIDGNKESEISGIVFKGISKGNQTFLNQYIIQGVIPQFGYENDSILLSKNMTKKLKASVGDKISAFFIINGKPKQRNYFISGIYETGLDKIDDQFGFIDIKQLTKINKWGLTIKAKSFFTSDTTIEINCYTKSKEGEILYALEKEKITSLSSYIIGVKKDTNVTLVAYEVDNVESNNLISVPDTLIFNVNFNEKIITQNNTYGSGKFYTGGYEIMLTDLENDKNTLNSLKSYFGPEYLTLPIEKRFEDLFSWLSLIYQNVYIIILLMIAVAIVNMSTALLVLIVEKTKMIGILKSIGISNKSLIRVFVIHGGILLAIGFTAGNLIAYGIMFLQNKYQFLTLPKENYYIDAVPMHYPIEQFLALNGIAFIICFAALILPSLLSSRISPVKAINSEI